MRQSQRQAQQTQHEMRMEQDSHRAAAQIAAEKEAQKVQNPDFLEGLQDPDVDTDLWNWVEDELGPTLSGAHILGHRSEHFEDQQSLLNRNKVERMVAERSPGRLYRQSKDGELMLALAQGIQGTARNPDPTQNPRFRDPLTPRKERVIRDAAEVMTTRQTLSIGGRGVDAVSTATVENRTVTNEKAEESGVTGRVKKVFR